MLDTLSLICIAAASLLVVVTVTYYGKALDTARAERDQLLNELDDAIEVITGLNSKRPAPLRVVR